MRDFRIGALGLITAILFSFSANAVVIEFTSTVMRAPNGPVGNVTGQTLENQINSQFLAPQGLGSIEFGATDGGTSAVDSMTFEGPGGPGTFGGLTVITGFGFIYRFDSAVSDVRVRFTNYKDDEIRRVYAFDKDVSYVREDPNVANNQHILGNPLAFPDLNDAIDFQEATLPAGGTDILDLTVNGNISSILVRSNKFLWTLREIEFNTVTAVHAPGALATLTLGVAGLAFFRRRSSVRA